MISFIFFLSSLMSLLLILFLLSLLTKASLSLGWTVPSKLKNTRTWVKVMIRSLSGQISLGEADVVMSSAWWKHNPKWAHPTLWALASSSFSLSYPFSRTSITDGLRSRDRLSLRAPHSSPSSPDMNSADSASRPGTLCGETARVSYGLRLIDWVQAPVFLLPSIVAVPRCRVHRLSGQLICSQWGGEARRRRSQRVGAI